MSKIKNIEPTRFLVQTNANVHRENSPRALEDREHGRIKYSEHAAGCRKDVQCSDRPKTSE